MIGACPLAVRIPQNDHDGAPHLGRVTPNEVEAVLHKHERYLRAQSGGQRADLRNEQLVDVRLANANLRDANLAGANLRRSDVSRADFTGAVLTGTNLESAQAAGTNFERADLRGVRMRGAKLTQARLKGADLRPGVSQQSQAADLRESVLDRADLEAAKLIGAAREGHPVRGAAKATPALPQLLQ